MATTTIVRLTPEQKPVMTDLARELRTDTGMLVSHVLEDASVRMLRQDLEAIRDGANKALRALGDTL